jgi:hypothetical protein
VDTSETKTETDNKEEEVRKDEEGGRTYGYRPRAVFSSTHELVRTKEKW